MLCFTACMMLSGCGAGKNSIEATDVGDTSVNVYEEIIGIYHKAQEKGCTDIQTLPDDNPFPGYDGSLNFVTSVCDSGGSSFYYSIYDFDNNGVNDLAVFNDHNAVALYTASDNRVLPLAFGQYRNVLNISDDGEVFLLSYGGHKDYQIYKYHFIDDGKSLKTDYVKGTETGTDGSVIYYSYPSMEGSYFFDNDHGDKNLISEAEFKNAEEECNNAACSVEKIPV